MLTEEQIHAEAEQALACMDPEERKKKEDRIRAHLEQMLRARTGGYSSLDSLDKYHYRSAISDRIWRQGGGSTTRAAMEHTVINRFHVSKDEIPGMQNPYSKSLRKSALLTGGAVLCAVASAVIDAKTNWNLSWLTLMLFAAAFFLLFPCMGHLLNALRFKNLQKSYDDPKARQIRIDAEMDRILAPQIKAQLAKENPEYESLEL